MEFEVVVLPTQGSTEQPGKSDLPAELNTDEINADETRLATTVEITIGCIMTLLVVVCMAALICRKSTFVTEKLSKFRNRNEKMKWMEMTKDYDTMKNRRESTSAVLPEVLSGDNFTNGSQNEHKKSDDASINTLSLPSNGRSGSRSPMITRSLQHGTIPFTLPPMVLGEKSSFKERAQPSYPKPFRDDDNILSSEAADQDEPIGEELSEESDSESPSISGTDKSKEIQTSSVGNFRNSFLGQIMPELYKYSEHAERDLPPSQFGRIWFTLVYDAAVEALTVKVIKIRQLPGRGSNVPHDCFVKLFLLPDERMSQQTKVKRRTNNPRFNETFVFQASSTDIKERTLRLSVYDVDKRKVARHLLGHALVTLSDVDMLSQSEDVMWRDLDERAHPGDSGTSLGEVNMSLSYLPSLNRLTVVVLRARNLREIDLEETGVYIKVTLTHGHQVVKTKKTVIKRGDCDPNYNESFSFTVSSKDVESSCLCITVVTIGYHNGIRHFTSSFKNFMSTGKSATKHKYGRVVVGSFMFCRGEQLLHWQEMLAEPRKAITKWHPLSEIASSD